MAVKVRPSSANSRPGPQEGRPLAIGSKASAAAPPARLRSPPRPPLGAGGRGVIGKPSSLAGPPVLRSIHGKVTTPPRHDAYRPSTNSSMRCPAPTPSRPAAALTTAKGSAPAPPAINGNKSWERENSDQYPPKKGFVHARGWNAKGVQDGLDPHEASAPHNGNTWKLWEKDPGFENQNLEPNIRDNCYTEDLGQEVEESRYEIDGFEQEQIETLPEEQEEQGLEIGEFENNIAAEEDDTERQFRDELYKEMDPDMYQEKEHMEQPQDQDFEDNLPRREGDLSLDEIPEDHREAVEGSEQVKRALSQDSLGNSPAKRRRLDSGRPLIENETAHRLIRDWRLEQDSTTTFVLRMADPVTIDNLAKTRWAPNPRYKRTYAEQVYEQLTKVKEHQGPPAGPLDAVAAFGHRWHLNAADDEALSKLDHKSMRHIFHEYDKSRPLAEIIEDTYAGAVLDEDVAAPDKPGLYVLGRSQCLELIDPFGDALVLGDANLSFSLQLAEHRKSLHHCGRTIATTFENLETLRERYKEIDGTVKLLKDLGAEVLHNVDCTRLAVDPRFQGMEEKFGAVYYNFPHAGVVPGFFDGHPFVRWRHANLMHLFFRALRTFVKPGGVVKVASNSNATGVRFSDIIGGASASEFAHAETFPFLEWILSRYRRSYGDRRDAQKRPDDGEVYRDQRAQSDMVYCFTYTPTGRPLKAPSISYPPTKEELLASNEGGAGRLPNQAVARRKRVEELYELFLSYVQGIHVG